MTAKMQLISFAISFLYGFFFNFLTIFNFKLMGNLKVIYKHIITFVYVIDMAIIYIIILYNLNKGYFHIYFILMVILGYILSYVFYLKILSKINVKRIFKDWKELFFMLSFK